MRILCEKLVRIKLEQPTVPGSFMRDTPEKRITPSMRIQRISFPPYENCTKIFEYSNMNFIFSKAICIFLIIHATVEGEIFSSMSEVENIFSTEQDAADGILRYVERHEKKLEGLKRFSKDCHSNQENPGSAHSTDPLGTFLLIKRLEDWNMVKKLISHNDADFFLKNITKQRNFAGASFPQQEDLTGAAVALFRLQDTYKLNPKDIADGRIPGVLKGEKLSAFDCFELGRVAYLSRPPDYYHTLLWMQEAHDRLKTEVHPSVKESLVLEHLSYAMYHQDNVERATVLARKVKKLDPKANIDDNLEFYELELVAMRKDPKKVNERSLPPLNLVRPPPDNLIEKFDLYEQLCRDEVQMSEAKKAKLYCYYKRNRPFLTLAPLKAEIIHLRPMLIVFRQAVSETESAMLKELAGPRLARAMIQNRQGKDEPATYRVSKRRSSAHPWNFAWLADKVDPLVKKISKRVEDMADLTSSSAEELQLANYGLGGHYEPHFDFAEKDEVNAFKDLNTGNRIATAMCYLSQPLAGGYTVFPDIKLAIPPTKNDCVLWYNLYKNGDGDELLRHAACPVLAGNKWVANKWLHEYGQEFLRPCAVDRNEYE